MYPIVLTIHSWFRWVVLVVAFTAVALEAVGWLGKRPWTERDSQIRSLFSYVMDIQVLFGLTLYVALSPITARALRNFGVAMQDPTARFFSVEHITLMILAIGLVHAARAVSRRATDATARHRVLALFFGAATLVILLAIPWPFLSYGRPLFRLG